MVYTAFVVPESEQWWGIGREATPGTAVAPTISIPLDKGTPEDKFTYIVDKSIQGDMAADHGDIQGVAIADFAMSGNVYTDVIGHMLYNLFGDYTATGAAGSGSTTLTAPLVAGATTATVAAITGFSNGQAVQIGITADGNPEIVVLSAAPSGTTLTFTNTPARSAHASGKTVAGVVAPFTHNFSLLNSGTGQPPAHTITHHQNLTATYGARQYAYWCASGIDFKMSPEQLFTHDTKGTAVMGTAATATPTNSQSTVFAQPNWRWKVGVGGPASGGTLLNDVEDCELSFTREVKPKYTLQAVTSPFIIARLVLGATGKLTITAQDESPLLAYIADTVQQLQMVMTASNGDTVTFNYATCKYETATLAAPDVLTYEVNFRAIANTTNVGQSGGKSPAQVILTNSVATY